MSVPSLVQTYYDRIWNEADYAAASELLAEDVHFRGSLGEEMHGRDALLTYVRSVHGALARYRCEILDCVTEGNEAFAKLRFSGDHVAALRGFPPSGKPLHWLGAALFRFTATQLVDIWVLGDLAGLDAMLRANEDRRDERP